MSILFMWMFMLRVRKCSTGLVSVVKGKLVGAVLVDGSNGVNIAASVGPAVDHDSALRPAVYQRHMSFYVNLDRGE